MICVGDEIPPWEMPVVEPARMRTMAAILRDPYSVHWDADANAAIGLPGRVINQGPLNLGYVVNMLMAWAGPSSIRRLTVSFGSPVLDGDLVIAHGLVVALSFDNNEHRATCEIRLDRDGRSVVTGTAVVCIDGISQPDESAV
jgi:acyl dehydratase